MPGMANDVFSVGGEDDDAEARQVDGVAGMHDAARLACDGLQIRRVVVARDVGVFAILAVIEELADGHALHQFGHAAHVVDVVVSHEQMIDLRDAGVAHGGLNAVGVAAIVIRPARIDQQRCAGGRNQQRRLAALDIDGVDA